MVEFLCQVQKMIFFWIINNNILISLSCPFVKIKRLESLEDFLVWQERMNVKPNNTEKSVKTQRTQNGGTMDTLMERHAGDVVDRSGP